RARPRRGEAVAREGDRPAAPRQGCDAAVQGRALHQADRRRRRVRCQGHPVRLNLPADFPRDAEVVATDLDHTLTWTDGVLRPHTLATLARAEAPGVHVIVVTGRMVQSLRRVLDPAGLSEPV